MRHSSEFERPAPREASLVSWLLGTLLVLAALLALGASVMGLLNSVQTLPTPAAAAPPAAPVLVAQPTVSSSDRVVPTDDARPWREHGRKGKHGHKKHHGHGH